MELDYTGARTLEEARAIKKAFWDRIYQEQKEGKWKEITREEFHRQVAAIRAQNRWKKEQEEKLHRDEEPPRQQPGEQQTPDHAA